MRLLLADAIKSLRPNSEFSYTQDDYSTIQWVVLEGDAPTEAEVRAEFRRLQDESEAKSATRLADKTALLERLGITEDEAKLLLG
jgi:hypothetical protein